MLKSFSPQVLYWGPAEGEGDWLKAALQAALQATIPGAELVAVSSWDSFRSCLDEQNLQHGPPPALLIIPPIGSFALELVQEMKSCERLRMIPVVAFTNHDQLRQSLYDLQVNCCVEAGEWPPEQADLLPRILRFWLQVVLLPAETLQFSSSVPEPSALSRLPLPRALGVSSVSK